MKSPRRSPPPAPPPSRSAGWFVGWRAAVLLLAGWWVFSPVIRGEWLWDDNSEITSNLVLRDPGGLRSIWLAPPGPDYLPLKTTVQWLEWRLWQDRSTSGYHCVSIALHLASALLLGRIFRRLGVKWAWAGAVLFAVHPIVVESVAWIAELKNTLSLLWLLFAMDAWIDYDERRGWSAYVRALLCFLAAMLCKGSVVMFPAVLLLFAWWKRGLIRWADMKATVPFFAVSLVLGMVTIWFQQTRAIGGGEPLTAGLMPRLAGAVLAIGFYAAKSLAPVGLAPIYPPWAPGLDLLLPLATDGALIVGIVVAWRRRATWGRHVLFGLGFFVLNLVPVLGLIDMSYLRVAPVADHFMYLAVLGFVGLVAAGAGEGVERLAGGSRIVGLVAAAFGLAVLAIASRAYARVFVNQEMLWSRALQRNPQSWLAENNLGALRLREEKWTEAAEHFRAALALKPDYASAQANLGVALAHLGRPDEALAHGREALRLDPDSVDAHYNLANILVAAGLLPEAVTHYEAALRIAPASVDAHYNLANVLVQLDRPADALLHYDAAVRLNPALLAAQLNFGNLLAATEHLQEATEHFVAAVRIAPESAEAHYCLADALAGTGRLPESLSHYEAAIRLGPPHAGLQTSFARALFQLGRLDEAQAHGEEALRLQPDLTEARTVLNQVRAQLRRSAP